MYTNENLVVLLTMAQGAVKTGLLAKESLMEMLNVLKTKLSGGADEKEELLTMTELVKKLKLSRPTIYRLINSGKLKQRKIGRQNRFLLSEVRKMLEEAHNE